MSVCERLLFTINLMHYQGQGLALQGVPASGTL